MIRKLSDIDPVPIVHGSAEKRVLVDSNESGCSITQIAITDVKRGEVIFAHMHTDIQEGFYILEGELSVVLDGKKTVCGKDTFVYVDKCTWHEMTALQDSRIMSVGCVVEASRNKLYPMLFKPNCKTLVWGTEDWTVSGVEGNESVVENGTWANYRLNDVIRRRPAEILGKKTARDYHDSLPLLTKIIDARQDLSIQVHPDNEMAEREHHKSGKSEMWYILDAKPGSFLYAGLKQHVTPDEYRQRVAKHVVPYPVILFFRDPAVQTGHGYIVAGNILPHQADRGTRGKLVPDPGKQVQAFGGKTGKDQVADKGTAAHDAVFIVYRGAGLAAHFLQRGGSGGKVIRRAGAYPAGPLAEMLQVRKVYVDHPFQPAKGFHGFITGGVPDEGEGRTPEFQRFQDPGNKRGSGDERQGVNTEIRQALQGV